MMSLVRTYYKYPIPGRVLVESSLSQSSAYLQKAHFRCVLLHRHTKIWTQHTVSIKETSMLVALGVQSKLSGTKFGKSETSQLGMGHLHYQHIIKGVLVFPWEATEQSCFPAWCDTGKPQADNAAVQDFLLS